MRTEEQFDSFYLKTRRALVHQAFALTGDLAAAQRAVRDTYVQAWHHWRKVRTHEDPRDWVRPRAWALAQRRHTARLWQRTRDLSGEDRAVLDALHGLSGAERRALLLVELAGVPLDVAARELNLTHGALDRQHRAALTGFAAALEIEPDQVRSRLLGLAEVASRASLPRPPAVRREGRNRRRLHTVAAAAATTFLAVGSGAFAHEPAPDRQEATRAGTASPDVPTQSSTSTTASPVPESTLPSAHDLLGPDDLRLLGAKAGWSVTETHDNTAGDGFNYVCQQERFADPDGLGTIVQTSEAARKPPRAVVQAVEISHSAQDASGTFDTLLSWFAECGAAEVQLERMFEVDNVGDRAVLLDLEGRGVPRWSWTVGIAQVGQVTTTSVVRSPNQAQPGAALASKVLARSARLLCERAGDGPCADRPRLQPATPPPAGEFPGALATLDLPPLPGVRQPWVGTRPVPAAQSPVTPSSCDRAQFRREGASRIRTRTFVVPGARLPDTFGLTETYGTFATEKRASTFLEKVRARLASCEDRDLATEVMVPSSLRGGQLDGATWRLRTELSESRDVVYDVGFVRHGRAVAQVTFVPAPRSDLAPGAFRALVTRAGQRLAELEEAR